METGESVPRAVKEVTRSEGITCGKVCVGQRDVVAVGYPAVRRLHVRGVWHRGLQAAAVNAAEQRLCWLPWVVRSKPQICSSVDASSVS